MNSDLVFFCIDDLETVVNELVPLCFLNKQMSREILFSIILASDPNFQLGLFRFLRELVGIMPDNNEIPVASFSFINADSKKPVAQIITYLKVYENEIYYGLHSETLEEYSGLKLNQFLRSVFILSALCISYQGRKIDYIGSNAIASTSSYIWSKKFGFPSFQPPYVEISPYRLRNLTAGIPWTRLAYRDYDGLKARKELINSLLKLNIPITLPPGIPLEEVTEPYWDWYFSTEQYRKDIQSYISNLVRVGVKDPNFVENDTWSLVYPKKPGVEMNFIAQNNEATQEKAILVLRQLLTSVIGNCSNQDIDRIVVHGFENPFSESLMYLF